MAPKRYHHRPNATEVVEMLRQTDSASKRSEGVKRFGKSLRRGALFAPAWAAVGGAPGLVDVMAQLSVSDIRFLCRLLCRAASARGAREERRAAMDELVGLLYDSSKPRDKRPLHAFYKFILPACSAEVMVDTQNRHQIKFANTQEKRLRFAHPELAERRFLENAFSSGDKSSLMRLPGMSRLSYDTLIFKANKMLFRGNIQFCERVLTTLINTEAPSVPFDFLTDFATPLLCTTLERRHYSDEQRDMFLGLVVQGMDKDENHISKAPQISISRGIIPHVVNRWRAARGGTREQTLEAYLVRLLRLVDRDDIETKIQDVHQATMACTGASPDDRFTLVRLFLLHLKAFRFDIADPAQSARLLLPCSSDQWPPELFLSIGSQKGLELLEKLDSLHTANGFIELEWGNTVLQQCGSPGASHGDVEILRALLYGMMKGDENDARRRRLRSVVQDRKKTAEQSREAPTRAFWALSVLNLSVAIGNLDLLHDCILWARRFTKDSLAVRELFDVANTAELQDLLCVLSSPKTEDEAAKMAASLPAMRENIILGNLALLALIQSAAMVALEPGAKSQQEYTKVCRLPASIYHARVGCVRSLKEILTPENAPESLDLTLLDSVWKPTVDLLVDAEKLRRSPGGKVVYESSSSDEVPSPGALVQDLPRCMASALAELAAYTISKLREAHGPEDLDARMGMVVRIIMEVAQCDNPSLACPFISSAIVEGGDNSSWHRQLLTTAFLSALPADTANEFLHTMADAMAELMRKQQALPWVEGQKPAIKVTTIKMMAAVLHKNVFVDASSSCDILISLLVGARHIDARIAVVDSLISVMEDQTCPDELRTRILDSLEQHVVPAAADVNQRRQLTEADWAEAAVPEVGEDTPLLDLLVRHSCNTKLRKEDKERLIGLVMDVLLLSATNNVRWMKAYMASHNVTLGQAERLPNCPVNPQILSKIFEDLARYAPLAVFNMVRERVLARFVASPAIKSVTDIVTSDRDLKNSNAGKQWLRHFGEDQDPAWPAVVHVLQRTPADPEATRPLGEVGVEQLHSLLLDLARAQIRAGDRDGLYSLVDSLTCRRFIDRGHYSGWKSNCSHLVRRIIDVIELERAASDREPGSGQAPVLLPHTFRLKIAALLVPFSSPEHPASAEDVDACAAEVVELIERDLADPERRVPYFEDIGKLLGAIGSRCVFWDSGNRVRFSQKLADMGDEAASLEHPPLAAYLRLQTAVMVLRILKSVNAEQWEQIDRLIRFLKGCRNEGLKAKGWSLEGETKSVKLRG